MRIAIRSEVTIKRCPVANLDKVIVFEFTFYKPQEYVAGWDFYKNLALNITVSSAVKKDFIVFELFNDKIVHF